MAAAKPAIPSPPLPGRPSLLPLCDAAVAINAARSSRPQDAVVAPPPAAATAAWVFSSKQVPPGTTLGTHSIAPGQLQRRPVPQAAELAAYHLTDIAQHLRGEAVAAGPFEAVVCAAAAAALDTFRCEAANRDRTDAERMKTPFYLAVRVVLNDVVQQPRAGSQPRICTRLNSKRCAKWEITDVGAPVLRGARAEGQLVVAGLATCAVTRHCWLQLDYMLYT